MSRFDRRLKGATNKKSGSGAACVPQPIPRRGPLLSGMMFGGSTQQMTPFIQRNTVNSTINQSLDSIVNEVNNTETSSKIKISDTNIDMIHRRLRRLESNNGNTSKTNKVYESLDKRLGNLEKMYSENMENMEKYVRNQEDRINLLTADYRKTLETLNKIIKDMNIKIVELDTTTFKKPEPDEFDEEVTPEKVELEKTTPQKATIVSVKKSNSGEKTGDVKLPKATIVSVKNKTSQEKNDEKVIQEVTEEMLSKVSDVTSKVKKNISFTVTEKEEVST
jgi:hypothetical protein